MTTTRIPVSIDRAWHVGADGVSYPPEPWYLGGDALMSAFVVPRADLPAEAFGVIPSGARLLTVAGKVLVVAAVLHYTEGGVLQYEELLTTYPVVSVRHGVRVSIPDIWVTSPNSRTGGRELWGIPKHLGELTRERSGRRITTAMTADGRYVASLEAQLGPRLLPGSHQIPLPTAQVLEGRTSWSTNRIVARLRTARTRWTFAPDGPLGYLAGRRSLVSVATTDAAVLFGTKVSHN
ncbi:acetoacetate decarboxylase family protein [Gordonia polyisoprenivorans]|uniref:acetoacetate decarboxylase family protein n=1 Tax=Gordonia polyisoprenivorans TaxID=84595 RepID=UPI001AD67C55|nr:acetoacetate decarboxylase family protein [Gordonia polyisoprenivorans]QTI67195.1 acetoacetate decarboxylase family protein [Gordonia polyisoprenivorans]